MVSRVIYVKLRRFYAILSGEHVTLPLAELRAILESENHAYVIDHLHDNVVIYRSTNNSYKDIISRAGMVKEVGLHVASITSSREEFYSKLRELDICSYVKGEFAIRLRRFKGHRASLSDRELIDALASKIISECRLRVNLVNPKTIVRVVVTEGVVVIGVILGQVDTKSFSKRSPAKRPFFRPGALSVELSRVFVNLSRPKREYYYLDPFCGTGGFLIEALFMGYKVIGIDLNPVMIEGARVNIEYYGFQDYELIHGDATKLPLKSMYGFIGSIGTDPPYGRSTSTIGRGVEEILVDFLNNAVEVIVNGGYIVFATPHYVDVTDIVRSTGLYLVEKHYMRVHGSLTRILWVTRRP